MSKIYKAATIKNIRDATPYEISVYEFSMAADKLVIPEVDPFAPQQVLSNQVNHSYEPY